MGTKPAQIIDIVGQNRAQATFKAREDGEIVTVDITLADYKGLALKDAGAPKTATLPKGKTWIFMFAAEFPEFDTTSKKPEDGSLFLDPVENTLYVFDKAADKVPLKVSLRDFPDVQINGKAMTGKIETADFILENGVITAKTAQQAV